jgi:FimV N-terminal domain
MVRSLTFAVALALGTVSIPAYALGLGDIKTASALNQEFKADIALLSVAKGELDGVQVKLASADEFEKAGIERPFYLTLLKFKPERLPDGRAVIRVTSDFPIREPFLDFLVEINWPKGRLIREYTVLLDPPVTTRRRAPQVRTASAPVSTSRAAATPRGETPSVVAGKGEYGPVRANETLWSIARKLRPKGASMQQMMIALHRANPDAFIEGDINRLKRGQVLRVPSADEVLSLSRAEARRAYRQAQAQWLAWRSERMQQAAGRKAATSQGPAGTTLGGEPQSELRIATARPEGKGEAGASEIRGDETIDDIKRKLLLARENAEASRLESESLRNEVDELQKRLDEMRRLLMLKDDQLARLQAQTRESLDTGAERQTAESRQAPAQEPVTRETVENVPVEDAAQAVSEGASLIEPDLIAAADAVVEEANVPGGGAAQAVDQPEPAAGTTRAAGEARREAVAENTEERASSAAADSAQSPTGSSAQTIEVPPVSEDLDIVTLLRDNLLIVAAGGGALALLLVLLGIRRKRAAAEEEEAFDDLLVSPPDEESAVDASADTPVVDADEKEGEVDEDSLFGQEATSLLSDFTPSEMNPLGDETGEVDPISEADVYIAYGRYQQVEDLLKQAMRRDPDRLALKQKLLEVYYATRNVAAFNELAESMVENGQDIVDPDAWSRICEMGREIAPDNSLYRHDTSGQVTPEVDAGDVDAESAAGIEEEKSGLASLDDPDGDEGSLLGLEDEPSLDLDDFKELEELDDLDTRPLEPLDSLDLDLSSVENVAEADRADEAIDLPALDIVAGEGGVEQLGGDDERQTQLEELSDLAELEDDLNRLTEELASDLDATSAPRGLDEPLSIDEAFDKAVDEEIDISTPPPETADTEAVDTKLDLARAFLEMGDAEGAKGILEEIRQEGNETQREEAEKLLADIS